MSIYGGKGYIDFNLSTLWIEFLSFYPEFIVWETTGYRFTELLVQPNFNLNDRKHVWNLVGEVSVILKPLSVL